MSDRARIIIDCTTQTVEVEHDVYNSVTIGRQLETCRAGLITQILMPHIKQLMSMSTQELTERHLGGLCK